MNMALQISRRWCFAALIAASAGLAIDPAAGQTVMRTGTSSPPRQLHPTGSGVRSAAPVRRPAQLTSHRRVVSQDDIVEGATYMEDPETGQLLATDGMMLPGAPAEKGKIQPEPAISQEIFPDEAYGEVYGDAFGGKHGESCGEACCVTPCAMLPVGNLEIFGGVQGFTGPRNRGGSGSFGFEQGLNWSVPIPGFAALGGQIGFRAVQSNLSGAEFTNASRDQGFVTAGLFRRVDVGLQGGLVMDYLAEGWYNDIDLVNLRGEISWVIDGVHDVGFWLSAGTKSADEPVVGGIGLESWESTDLYAFFYRMQFGGCRDGDARLFAGWTSGSDGLLGLDARLPLGTNWALETNVAYLIPSEGTGTGLDAGHAQESWNIGVNVVWYPGSFFGHGDYYYRPLFRVADNGTFMVDRN